MVLKNNELTNLKKIRIHDFRYNCAFLLINNNASITLVANCLEHTKIDAILDTYSHLVISTLDEIINVIEALEDNKTDD
jgi:site-specific recombinase XerD